MLPSQQRFTLIEVIIAISLMVIVIGVLFLGTGTVMSSWEQLGRHAQSLEEMLALDRTIDGLLSNIIPFTWPDEEENTSPSTFYGESDRIVFTYIHAFNRLADGAIRCCTIFVEDNELVAYYSERPPLPENLDSDLVRRSVLAYNVDSISLEYADLDEDTIDMVDDWEENDYVPLGVQLRIRWLDGTEHIWFRRTAGSGFYERWGKWEQKERK